jgi:hypothetical protein
VPLKAGILPTSMGKARRVVDARVLSAGRARNGGRND